MIDLFFLVFMAGYLMRILYVGFATGLVPPALLRSEAMVDRADDPERFVSSMSIWFVLLALVLLLFAVFVFSKTARESLVAYWRAGRWR